MRRRCCSAYFTTLSKLGHCNWVSRPFVNHVRPALGLSLARLSLSKDMPLAKVTKLHVPPRAGCAMKTRPPDNGAAGRRIGCKALARRLLQAATTRASGACLYSLIS
jgi:hypothetical protein